MHNTKKLNKGVQLITYPDSIGSGLSDLNEVIHEHLIDYIESVHILPFYPSSADRGFAPLTHSRVDPGFGTKDDIKAISKDLPIMADLIVNHVSSQSKYFQDYIEKGDKSKYRNYFVKARYFARRLYFKPKSKIGKLFVYFLGEIATILRKLDFIFHKQGVNKEILKKIYRPRPSSPFVKYKRKDGKTRYLWCTFSPEQIDLNIDSQAVRRKLRRDIRHLESLGVRYLRLDAVAYVGKRRGTNSFLIPKTITFIKWLTKHAHNHNMLVVPEIHFDYQAQLSMAKLKGVDYVYDFSLPFLMLHALYEKNTTALKNWIKIRPHNSISTLDTHDGIGVVDVKGLLSEEEIERTSQEIYKRGGNATKRASGTSSNNVDTYQINCSYYSALDEDDDSYLLARAIQLFLPGIPQIYYVGLFAGENDVELLKKTKIGRDINRHFYSKEEIKEELERPVVKKLLKLCKLRNNHPAFQGKFQMEKCKDQEFILNWQNDMTKLVLKADFSNYTFSISELKEDQENKLF